MANTIAGRIFSWTTFKWLMITGLTLAIVGAIAVVVVIAALSRDLPTIDKLAEYEPPITSRVHAGDGTLIAEFAQQHRVYVPYESIPEHVVQAFVSAEDKNFFTHEGLDFIGMARGAINSARNTITGRGGLQGGSTITQQVVKNMLLTRDQTIRRKIKEAILARRVEKAFTKPEIIELYLNEIFLGYQSYGVGSAALNYFDKSLTELDLSEAAILASLAKAPSTVNPYRRPERLIARRNYVLSRMVEDGFIDETTADEAKAQPLTTVERLRGPEYAAATYFVQELRQDLLERYGEDKLETGGLSIRSTIDTRLQLTAMEALQSGLEAYDRRNAYRGPFATLPLDNAALEALGELTLPPGHGTWEAGLIKTLRRDGTAVLLLEDGEEIALAAEDVAWAEETFQRSETASGLRPGDVVLAEFERKPIGEVRGAAAFADIEDPADRLAAEAKLVPVGEATLRQVPDVEGALIALDPHTGRILALAGGYSYWKSAFNRVTQAERQPGSAFKPFVYAAALENGYTPVTRVLDAPFVDFDVEADEFWAPGNYAAGRFYGLSTIRLGLEQSRNPMTVRMAQDIGMEAVSDFAARTGVHEDLDPYLAMALGAGETTLWRMAKGYASFVNGGKAIEPTLLDRVQDRYGSTLYRHDERACKTCEAEEGWTGGPPPRLPDEREQVMDPIVAYQIVHMLEGVIDRGTGRRAARIEKHLAGKTGTTNDYKDALFFGMSPDLVVGVWVGFDQPRTLGEGEAGGSLAAPIFTDFMEKALEGRPDLTFRRPPGVRLVRIDARTGELPGPNTEVVIEEAFRPGTEPGFNFSEEDELSIFGDGGGGAGFGAPGGGSAAPFDEGAFEVPAMPGVPSRPPEQSGATPPAPEAQGRAGEGEILPGFDPAAAVEEDEAPSLQAEAFGDTY